MTWDFQLSSSARRAFRSMPSRDRERINRVLNEMKLNPVAGDIVPLKGEYDGQFRRRVGSWRIIFRLRSEDRVVLIGDILRRGSTTY